MTTFAVEQRFGNDWESCWTEEDENGKAVDIVFQSREEAEEEIQTHISDCLAAVEEGCMEDAPTRDEFRITKVG